VRLNLTARSCDDSSCVGETFTDIQNDTSPQIITLGQNRYFQYRFDFITDDGEYSPQLSNVTINTIEYPDCDADTQTGIWTVSSAATITTNQTCKIIVVNNSATLTVNSNFSNVTVYIEAVNITVASGARISGNLGSASIAAGGS